MSLVGHAGSAAAKYNLGHLYQTGNGVAKVARQAAYWYTLAGQDRLAPAAYVLGGMYQFGEGPKIGRKGVLKPLAEDRPYPHRSSGLVASQDSIGVCRT
jgi:TPR repeat protein